MRYLLITLVAASMLTAAMGDAEARCPEGTYIKNGHCYKKWPGWPGPRPLGW
jgi:hypothetical protein